FLADGYWRAPDESAKSFSADPLDPARRIFRTGDIGRLLPDGGFQFEGRRDNQVKIRGYRVETREIENSLLDSPEVAERAVIVQQHQAENRLVGFVVAAPNAALDPDHLRARLRNRLPEWKVPAQIRIVPTLPLSMTGKVDRPALLRSLDDDGATDRDFAVDA